MKPLTFVLFAAMGLCLPVSVAQAQSKAETKGMIELTRKAIQTERQAIVTQAMDLSDTEAEAFWPLYRDWRSKVAGNGDRKAKLLMDFSDSYETLDDAKALALHDEWVKIKEADVKLEKEYVKKFRKILPAKKVVRFFQLENKMDAALSFDMAGTVPLAE